MSNKDRDRDQPPVFDTGQDQNEAVQEGGQHNRQSAHREAGSKARIGAPNVGQDFFGQEQYAEAGQEGRVQYPGDRQGQLAPAGQRLLTSVDTPEERAGEQGGNRDDNTVHAQRRVTAVTEQERLQR